MERVGEGTAQPKGASGPTCSDSSPGTCGAGGPEAGPGACFCPAPQRPTPCGTLWPGGSRTLRNRGVWAGVRGRLQDSEEGRVWERVTGLFWMFHSMEVPRTCLGLLCGYRDRVCHPGRVGTRKRREGRGPQHVSSKRLGAGGAQSDKAHRRASGPSRVLLSQTLPLQPCPQLGGGRQARPVGSSGQSGLRELWAVGREEEESPSSQSPLCPTLQTVVEKVLTPGLRRQSEVLLPPPMSLLLQSQPCPVHCGWQPRW